MAKVLLVEDDTNLREIFEMRLQAEGYETVTAGDGEEALAVAMKEKPDLIIADVMMPRLSGFEMLESLRAAPGMGDTKVIMMTALGQAEDQARGQKLGVVKYLVKSQVTLEDFAKVIREVLPPEGGTAPSTNKQESENKVDENPTSAPSEPAAAPGGDGGGDAGAAGGDAPAPAPAPEPTQGDENTEGGSEGGAAEGGASAPPAAPEGGSL